MAKTKKIRPVIANTPEELAQSMGLEKSAALEWQVDYEVTERIISVFGSQEITTTELAKQAETSRARITRILKRDSGDTSLDVLFRALGAFGQKVKIQFLKA